MKIEILKRFTFGEREKVRKERVYMVWKGMFDAGASEWIGIKSVNIYFYFISKNR